MDISGQTIKGIFDSAFGQKGNKLFIDFGGSEITYGGLKSSIGKFSTYFRSKGLNAGDRVVYSTDNERLGCILFLALLANGITAVPVDPGSGAERAEAIINHCRPELVFLDTQIQNRWNLAGNDIMTIIPIHTVAKKGFFQKIYGTEKTSPSLFPGCIEGLPESGLAADIDPASDAYIIFTSGTTSAPKGVRISYRALFSHLGTLSSVYRLDRDSRIFNQLILSHSDGIIQGPVLALYNAATLYRPFPFSIQRIEDVFDVVYREGISHWIMVPTMIGLICQFKQKDPDTLDQKGFRYIISCGGKLETGIWENFETKFKTRIINGYGLTETVTGGLFAGPDDALHVIGTIGKPVDCEARIMDENRQEKPIGEQGEIWMRGSLLMSGYLNAPEITNEVFDGEWLKTGDIGYKGEDGCFRITGRKKLVIISGGVNISPEEVTEVLHSHPAVQDAVTFGKEDDLWGEMVVSAILVKKEASLSQEEIVAYCRKHLEERKVPAAVYFVDELPYGPSGKVIVQRIKDKVAGHKEHETTNTLSKPVFLKIVSHCLQMPYEEVSMGMNAEETPAWDSISHLILVAEMEKQFNIVFLPLEVMNVKTLSDLYHLVKSKTER